MSDINWKSNIDASLKIEKDWRDKSLRIIDIYRGEKTAAGADNKSRRFNILYSNISTLLPAIFQKTPTPDIRRRFTESDEMVSKAASVMQKAIKTILNNCAFDSEAETTIKDQLLTGRGVMRVRYEPIFKMQKQIDEIGQAVEQEVKVWESVEPEHVYWENFTCEARRRWKDVNWIAFKHLFSKQELIENFQQETSDLVKQNKLAEILNHTEASNSDNNSQDESLDKQEKKALIWEIWDKRSRKVIWFMPDMEKSILREDDDPLSLEDFFPMPEPLYGVTTSDSLLPVPEYSIYQDLANEIEDYTVRIAKITEMIKVTGAHNFDKNDELADILASENTLVPVSSFSQEGLSKSIWMLPIEHYIQAVRELYAAREQSKQSLYDVSGISDILRGASNANETATAQRIKGNFGTLRINNRRKKVDENLRATIALMGEIVAQHFSAQTLQLLTGEEITPELLEFLQSDFMRLCNLDIETDSTIAPDEVAEQEATGKLMQALISYLEKVFPAVQAGIMPKEMAFELLKMAIKPFKGARNVEELITEYLNKDENEQDPKAAEQEAKQQQEQAHTQQMQQGQMQHEQMKQQGEIKKLELDSALTDKKAEVENLKLEGEMVKVD